MKTLNGIRHLKRYEKPEAFWSKSYAEGVAAKYPYLICAVDYSLYCDGKRDWTVHTYHRDVQ